jgi:imidazolonepropionase-like amidohydrolase
MFRIKSRALCCLFVMGVLMSCYLGPVYAEEASGFAITNVVIINGEGGVPIDNGTVLVKGQTIEAVGPVDQVKIPKDVKIIDGKGKAVLPGYCDMHVHLMGGWDGVAADILGYQRYLNSLLYCGVTTVLDVGNVLPFVLQMRQEVDAGRIAGPKIYCSGPVLDGADPYWPELSYAVSSMIQIPKLVKQLDKAGVDVVKAYVGLSHQMVLSVVREAKKKSLEVIIDPGFLRMGSDELILSGIASFAHMPTRRMSNETLGLMKERNVHCLTTLTVYESFSRRRLHDLEFLENPLIEDTTPPWFIADLRAYALRKRSEKHILGSKRLLKGFHTALENTKRMFDAGILLASGTDAPYPGVFQGEGIHREMELLVEAGLTPLQAITLTTKNAALLLNKEKEWGTLTPGLKANIVVIDGRPDKDIRLTRNVAIVIKEGQIIERAKLKFDINKDPGFRVSSSVAANK